VLLVCMKTRCPQGLTEPPRSNILLSNCHSQFGGGLHAQGESSIPFWHCTAKNQETEHPYNPLRHGKGHWSSMTLDWSCSPTLSSEFQSQLCRNSWVTLGKPWISPRPQLLTWSSTDLGSLGKCLIGVSKGPSDFIFMSNIKIFDHL